MTTTRSQRRALRSGSLWALAALMTCGAAVLILCHHVFSAPTGFFAIALILLALSALALATMLVTTLRRRRAYGWNADFALLPTVLGIPLRVGTWVGAALLIVVNVVLMLAKQGGGRIPGANARFAISLMASLGLLLTAAAAQDLPPDAMIWAYGVWLAIIAVAAVRGCIGFFARFAR